ncbi:MAG: T9SS type A sorting domain-containing protein, partial [Melioribacteraceae bacterium]|nr:T9SS type A sorting domain-containing protein [Melioribacteraceae bacterium]
DGDTDWAIGTNGNGVFTSDDLYGPWAERNTGLSGDALIINDITGYNDDDVDYAAIATNNGVFYSTDSMRTWVDISGSLTGGQLKVNRLMVISFFILAATDDGYYATTNYGETWIDGITGEQMNLIGVSYPGPGGFYYLMGENAYYSLDLSTWSPIDLTGVSGGYITATAVSSNYLYIGTETGGAFRRELDQITDVKEIVDNTLPENFILKQNYPNPFNPSTKIEFSIAPNKHNKKGVQTLLVVYDILGKKIKTLINKNLQPGNYSIDFDAAGLTSGVYFYTLYAGDFSQSNKMILTK